MTDDPVADALEAVADFFDEHDWIQGFLSDGKGGYCLLGACREVLGAGHVTDGHYGEIYQPLKDLTGYLRHYLGEVSAWNDAEGRTVTEVQAMCREAAVHRRRGG